VTPNPAPPLLAQLPARPAFAQDVIPALRIRDDVVVTLLETASGVASAQRPANLTVLASDPASGLAVIGVPTAPSAYAQHAARRGRAQCVQLGVRHPGRTRKSLDETVAVCGARARGCAGVTVTGGARSVRARAARRECHP